MVILDSELNKTELISEKDDFKSPNTSIHYMEIRFPISGYFIVHVPENFLEQFLTAYYEQEYETTPKWVGELRERIKKTSLVFDIEVIN